MTASVMSRCSSRWPPERKSGATNQLCPSCLDHHHRGRIDAWPPPSLYTPMKTNGQMRKSFSVADVVYDEKSSGTTDVVSPLSLSRCQAKKGNCTRVSSCLSHVEK